MKKSPLQQEAKLIHLSADEKKRIHRNLYALVHNTPVRKTATLRYNTHTKPVWAFLPANMLMKPMAITLIIAFLMSGGVSYAAEGALPGDAFYPVKVEINERVRGWVAVSEEAKTEWQTRVVERRLEEAETLAAENRFTADARNRIEANFEAHAERVEEHIARMEANENLHVAADISSNFETSLRTHAAVLERLNADAEIEHLIVKVHARVAQAAKSRQDAETRIATSTSANVKVAAEGRLKAAENKIAEVRRFIERSSASVEAKTEAKTRLELAATAITDGKAKIEAEAYNEAFIFFQKAHRLAQEAELILQARIRLPVDVQLDIRTNGKTRMQSDTEENVEREHTQTDIRIRGSAETEADVDTRNVESETRDTMKVEIGL